MQRFDDWSLRSKLLASLWLVVAVVSLMMMGALVLNLRLLRQQAIPDQRVILTLHGLAFDYLSEVREYIIEPGEETLEEIAEIEVSLTARLNEYRALGRGDDPREEAAAAAIGVELDRLTDAGHDTLRIKDRIQESLEATEAAEKELADLADPAPAAFELVTRGYELLAEIREYVLAPVEETAEELVEIEAGLAALSSTLDPASRGRVSRLLEASRTAARLRQDLDLHLERMEDAEQGLSDELDAAIAIAEDEVTEASRALLLSVLGTGVLGLALASLLALTVARRVSRPLELLQAASRRLAAGEFDARSPVDAADEVGRLSEDFNHLAAEVERLISELRAAKAFNESIVESVPSGLVTLDHDGRITSANPVFREVWGEGDPAGSRLSRWLANPELERAVETVLAGGDDVHGLEASPPSATEADAEIFKASVVGLRTADPADDAEQRPARARVLAIFEDVTESRRLLRELEQRLSDLGSAQTQLVQSGKMAAVGELAAGVAHELNNPLSVVLTYSMLLREKLERASEEIRSQLPGFDKRLDLMKTSSERCKTIIDNLLTFSRQDGTEISPVEVGDLLARTFDLIGSQLRRRQIALDVDVEDGLPPVRGNFNQLQQVLTNLAINAQQAMADGGELEVAARRRGEICELTVIDNGPGIPKELQERIFEPFFTTKPAGEGTGLGLAIAYGIVQSHDGEIEVDSVAGEGTTFCILLPFAGSREDGA